MTLSKIEKCARLMGYEVDLNHDHIWLLDSYDRWLTIWNPLTNKADLVDLMCAVGIDVAWREWSALALTSSSVFAFGVYADHPDKQTALAHAVVEVAVQIYDRKFGGE